MSPEKETTDFKRSETFPVRISAGRKSRSTSAFGQR